MPIDAQSEVDNGANGPEGVKELQRVREELQSTIEELQTSNEELKASHEEVISTNEELQSTNEELETSREEMQSLNEELSTVNSQLRAKMEEQEAASNDLSSLLASTNIAVLFLDTRLRIRRFTPPVRDLLDMLSTDLGRPLGDLARKFTDPHLDDDARLVLERLMPLEREVLGANERHYLRRCLPYRTADNRIDGVVITFVDITERKRAEQELGAAKDRADQSVRRLQKMMNIEGVGIMIFNNSGALLEANDAFLGMINYNRNEIAHGAVTWRTLTPPEYVPVSEQQLERLMETGRIGPYEKEYLRKDGSRTWLLFAGANLGDGTMVEYCIDINDRKNAEKVIETSREAAERANRVKDDFLATLSHELRTPLSAILLWSKLLDSGALRDEKQLREGLKAIKTSAEAQKELIEDLLDMSRITTGSLRLRLRDVDLVIVMRDALNAMEPAVEAKQLKMKADLDAKLGLVRADADRLRQVVWNLLSNAVKFTPPKGTVNVKLRRIDGEVEIEVSDNGRGINAEFLPHIFERFRQEDPSLSRAQAGIGVGLAIVKQLVELHGGTITAESGGLDRGARFVVRMPLPPVAPPQRARGRKIKSKSNLANLVGRRVLVVEDDVETRAAVAALLRQAGMKVTEAHSAAEALKSFEKARPDLLISDIGLPGADGYALIKLIRKREEERKQDRLPAIALTAFARETDRRMTIEAGYQQHVEKPVEPGYLLSVVAETLEGK